MDFAGVDVSYLLDELDGVTRVTGRDGREAFVGTRTRDDYWTAILEFEVVGGSGGLRLRMDDHRYVEVRICGGRLVTELHLGDDLTVTDDHGMRGWGATLTIRTVPAAGVIIHTGPDMIELLVDAEDGQQILARVDGRHLSTEVAGGFTGRVVGIVTREGSLYVRRFIYAPAVM